MEVTGKQYDKMSKDFSPPSHKLLNMLKAFLIGGAICCLGEGGFSAFEAMGLEEKTAKSLVCVSLIVITAVLTASGIFDRLARHAGAGTVVPITGFANAIVAPAMEFGSEGHILGTGAQMFKIAGPVIVYGSAACVIYGLIYYFFLK